MQLFYNAAIGTKETQITFDSTESSHIVRVLRKRVGDTLKITNGKGSLFFVEIILADVRKCVGRIFEHQTKSKLWDYYLHLAIAPTKNKDRYEWFLEKATEIGIDEITPIICQNSERKELNMDRMQKIVQSAMKQSLQYQLPALNHPIAFSSFLSQPIQGQRYIAHCKSEDKKSLKEILKKETRITILIGPEGDFSSVEIQSALKAQYIPITLGKTRLRTETAGIVAVQNVAFTL